MLAGRYELEVALGRGASGEVWRGRDVTSGRSVAVKLVNLDDLGDPAALAEVVSRFRREAETIVRLRHPNIVTAYEGGRMGNELFLVMELAEGVALSGMLRQRGTSGMGLFPVESVLRISEQVFAGLAAAHAAGVVHRDIKPSNIMVAARLQVKIIDFGIARLLEDSGPRLTQQGTTIGTIAYMSPEQAMGHEVDGRSDLYSYGCVMYELLAGRRPFSAATSEELLIMQVRATPTPLQSLRSDLPPGLYRLVDELLAKDPAVRAGDAAQVLIRVQALSAEVAAAPRQAAARQEADRETFAVRDEEPIGRPDTAPPTYRRQDAAPDPYERQPTELGTYARQDIAPEAGQGPYGRQPTERAFGPESGPGSYAGMPDAGAPGDFSFSSTMGGSVSSSGSGSWDPGPQTAPGADRANGTPEWPTKARPSRRRRRGGRSPWRGIVSSLITAAIVAGVGVYVYEKTHQTLKVLSASVAAPQVPAGCNVTVTVVGTIVTNGKGGPVTYQWIRHPGESPSPVTITVASGVSSQQVSLSWKFTGKGTTQATAELSVTEPNSAVSNVTFEYSCR